MDHSNSCFVIVHIEKAFLLSLASLHIEFHYHSLPTQSFWLLYEELKVISIVYFQCDCLSLLDLCLKLNFAYHEFHLTFPLAALDDWSLPLQFLLDVQEAE